MSNLDFAANALNAAAPPGERLAYVNPNEEGLLRAIGGSGRESSGGVPSYKKGEVEAPPPRDYGQEMADTLRAQRESAAGTGAFRDLGPQAQAEFDPWIGRPAYARGEMNMLWDSLLGEEPPPPRQPTYFAQATPTQEATGPDDLSYLFERGSNVSPPTWMGGVGVTGAPGPAGTTGVTEPSLVSMGLPAAEQQPQRGGLLELYEEHIAPSIMRQQKVAAEGEIDMLRELGPEFMQAQRAADPKSEEIRQMLQRRAQEGLAAGQGLTSEELGGVTESVRSGQAARGGAFQRSQPGMIQETLARLGAGRQAEAQRMQMARGVLQETSAVDPFLALTGRTARMPGQVAGQMGGAGFALQSGPQLYNPESQYAGALASGNIANVMNARMATGANQSAMLGGLLGGLGALGGGMFAGAGSAGGFSKMFR